MVAVMMMRQDRTTLHDAHQGLEHMFYCTAQVYVGLIGVLKRCEYAMVWELSGSAVLSVMPCSSSNQDLRSVPTSERRMLLTVQTISRDVISWQKEDLRHLHIQQTIFVTILL